MTVEDLKAYVGTTDVDNDYCQSCWDAAVVLVSKYIGTTAVPQPAIDRATLEVAAELYNHKSAPNGISQFATFDGQSALRIARDPMVAAYAILNPYLVVGF